MRQHCLLNSHDYNVGHVEGNLDLPELHTHFFVRWGGGGGGQGAGMLPFWGELSKYKLDFCPPLPLSRTYGNMTTVYIVIRANALS